MQRIDILKSWEAEVEQEWLGLIDATVAILDRLAARNDKPADTEAVRVLNDRTLAVSRRRGELWRQIAELEGRP
ncbi:hypothetical protein [Hyphomicrobium sp. CS1BSMeth3]|jgi:hypothetical protein|uniref:hypothetical protein n=1 Tax=Hyphomicrobium sp. CS1BSMeth3 TaxID=1892844 RepID=UPI00086EC8F9|nr:hypothetical protein [Hyphomicrobium sp. CS1BSMeth3]ODT30520.1 MAG: hypothetical protein ABS54_02340 [Hyphomicrobium sp. SCN 65-11]